MRKETWLENYTEANQIPNLFLQSLAYTTYIYLEELDVNKANGDCRSFADYGIMR